MIRYQLPKESSVKLQIYNLHGQLVRTLVDAKMKAGEATTTWNGKDDAGNLAPSGVYFYRLQVNVGEWTSTRKMILMR
jgi:flagellar hook assembly protein FlgD